MKKWTSLFLALVLTLCVGLASAETLTYWTPLDGGEGEVMQGIVDAWNAENPDWQVEHVTLKSSEYYTKLVTAVAGGQGPDMAISHVAKLPELVGNGVVTPLNDIAETAGFSWDGLNATIMKGCIIDDEIYALPLDTHCMILYYNKDILGAIGMLNEDGSLTVPQDSEEFITWLQGIQEKIGPDKYAFAFRSARSDVYRAWLGLYYQAGGAPVITSDCEVTLDKDVMVKTLEYMKRWYYSGVGPFGLSDAFGAFTSGNAAVTINGVWKVYPAENTEGLNFGIELFPQFFHEGEYAVWGDSHTLAIPYTAKPDEERQQAIFKFFEYVSNNSMEWGSRAGHIVANNSVVESEAFKALPYRSKIATAASGVVFFEPNPYTYPINDILNANVVAFLNDTIDAETAYNESVAEIEAMIE